MPRLTLRPSWMARVLENENFYILVSLFNVNYSTTFSYAFCSTAHTAHDHIMQKYVIEGGVYQAKTIGSYFPDQTVRIENFKIMVLYYNTPRVLDLPISQPFDRLVLIHNFCLICEYIWTWHLRRARLVQKDREHDFRAQQI